MVANRGKCVTTAKTLTLGETKTRCTFKSDAKIYQQCAQSDANEGPSTTHAQHLQKKRKGESDAHRWILSLDCIICKCFVSIFQMTRFAPLAS